MRSSHLIGIAPNHALFATPPVLSGQPATVVPGEQVDVVALSNKAVFRFLCLVDGVCKTPFAYIVLSEPAAVRRLRERRCARLRTKLAALYATDISGNYDGMGILGDLSPLGLSLATLKTLGQIGMRVRVAFRLRTHRLDAEVETIGTIRDVRAAAPGSTLIVHGIEFQQLDASQAAHIKAFIFDQQCASL
ncbi:hypothetical protein C9I57_01865 [Trinickia symbiotica]|uniref:Flagellar brake protein n=1 Tax=Trinickia symbiotica TaxID=863227 RepID=A0A2T3Y1C7_9BURK|nr:flagellar brake protein [Trinickia symbiotica]PTB22549.1 hypothetical protein C9I57_01865 [Trinickia symbiotica]